MKLFRKKIEITQTIFNITKPIFADVTKEHAYYNIHFNVIKTGEGIEEKIDKVEHMTSYRKDLEWIKEGEVYCYSYERAPTNKEKFLLNNPYKFNVSEDVSFLTQNEGLVSVKIKDRNVKKNHYYFCNPESLKEQLLGFRKLEKIYSIIINDNGMILGDIREEHLKNK